MGLFTKKKITYLVCGLGNPGSKYENTRHNAGFLAVDRIAAKRGIKINKLKGYSLCGEFDFEGNRVLLIKPQTFMNLSGKAVKFFADYYKIPPENVIVISDDVNLKEGVLRIRANGSEGGHNGLKSISEQLGSQNYPRMRIGVGIKSDQQMDLADWVLAKMSQSDIDAIFTVADKVNEALNYIIHGDILTAMSRYNG